MRQTVPQIEKKHSILRAINSPVAYLCIDNRWLDQRLKGLLVGWRSDVDFSIISRGWRVCHGFHFYLGTHCLRE